MACKIARFLPPLMRVIVRGVEAWPSIEQIARIVQSGEDDRGTRGGRAAGREDHVRETHPLRLPQRSVRESRTSAVGRRLIIGHPLLQRYQQRALLIDVRIRIGPVLADPRRCPRCSG